MMARDGQVLGNGIRLYREDGMGWRVEFGEEEVGEYWLRPWYWASVLGLSHDHQLGFHGWVAALKALTVAEIESDIATL